MISDLALARLAFAESPTSADALLAVARLRLEVEAVQAEAATRAADTGIPDAAVSVDISLEAGPATDRVDKKA
jgi:hypothetical protein